jgi:GH15 family glucan-1,4-alpha-glucosidase
MPNRYKAISDYGAIGNLRTVALVGRDAAIDWCCFPHLSSPSVFSAILDHHKGGRFRVAPRGIAFGSQSYIENTNVLVTEFEADAALLRVTDFLPLRGDIVGRLGSEAPPEIHRILRCEGGELEVEVEWAPRFDYARALPTFHRVEGGWLAEGRNVDGDTVRMTLGGMTDAEVVDDGEGPSLRGLLRLTGAESAVLVTRWDSESALAGLDPSMRWLDETTATWSGWARTGGADQADEWAGSSLPHVTRSELALKLLTHADSGAIAAAATTSLPETIGGIRNWDYRYCWIRDASLTVQALIALGHDTEAMEFLLWCERVSELRGDPEPEEGGEWRLQIMYGLHGESELDEFELEHFEGYRGSRPVRIGNAAAVQLQLDIFGELLNSAYELVRRGSELTPSLRHFLEKVADRACAKWDEPDYGLWEVRHGTFHFTYSKMMVWLALGRAAYLADRTGLSGDAQRWVRTQEKIREQILNEGYDPEVGAFVQYFGSKELDASNLLIPFYELLPYDDPRVQGTIDATLEHLTENGLVYRYHAEDGLSGEEGAFGLCTFWLVDALSLSGRVDEAWEIYEGIANRANHVGLFAEQLDPSSGDFLGNFPQAFTHIGLINSRLYLAHAEGKRIPGPPMLGTPEHRRELAAGGTVGDLEE